MKSASSPTEQRWMEQAFALAALGEGTTSPNPRVGCVLVRTGTLVGRGYHRAPGEPHAEARALREAGDRARGATMFINLEPCAHHGRTPPCADMILESGVRRVVAAAIDPNPLVNGRGFLRLEAGGIEVRIGLLSEQARAINAGFYQWHERGRPLVTLKAAISSDGMISAAGGHSRWITGSAARRFAHRLRLRHDAILVGAGTVRSDDPRLDARLEGGGPKRLRVVLAPDLGLSPEARILRTERGDGPKTRIYADAALPAGAEDAFRDRAEIVRVPAGARGLDLGAVLEDLARSEVQSLLVEGGGRTIGAFLEAGLADRAAVFSSPRLLGARGGTPLIDLPSVDRPDAGWLLDPERWISLGEDRLVLGRIGRGG